MRFCISVLWIMQSIGVAKCQRTDFAPFSTLGMFCIDVRYLSGLLGAETTPAGPLIRELGVDAIPVVRTT